MAKQSQINKSRSVPKYKERHVNRCEICGRPRAYIRYFGICRICFRRLAHLGELPGVVKDNN
jgi:small subunit ribosomal protein S14